mgnify:CR=1 FL=1
MHLSHGYMYTHLLCRRTAYVTDKLAELEASYAMYADRMDKGSDRKFDVQVDQRDRWVKFAKAAVRVLSRWHM